MGAAWVAFLGFFVFGAAGWYAAMLAFIIWVFFIVEKESFGAGIIALILCFFFLQFMGRLDVWGFIFGDLAIFGFMIWQPVAVALKVLGYIGMGFIWSFVKWIMYVNSRADKVKLAKDEFDANPERDRRDEWKVPYDLKKPVAMEHKGGIAVWVIYWPFSLLWTLFNNFLKDFVRWGITRLRKWYQGIADKAYKDLGDE